MSKKIEDEPEGKRESRPEKRNVRCEDGSLLVWMPSYHKSRDIPAVAIGRFRNGTPAIHFRRYDLRTPNVLTATREGISLSFIELDEIIAKLRAVAAVIMSAEVDDAA